MIKSRDNYLLSSFSKRFSLPMPTEFVFPLDVFLFRKQLLATSYCPRDGILIICYSLDSEVNPFFTANQLAHKAVEAHHAKSKLEAFNG
ncbi:hypothetical protein SAMN03159336_0685 [Enterobacter sp. NFIX59]|nr:hypothetical protein SAMN03159336_0685 [Enterobacter sp. NFIX59]